MRFLFLEPFFGGSHKEFAEGLVACSTHDIELLTLPARFWKWRMRGAALHFLRKIFLREIASLSEYDGIIASDLMSMSDFKALSGPDCPPALVYFHENQITYPLAPGESADFQFGFTDITTALAADRILFNSRTHFDAFFSGLPGFLKRMPEYRPKWVVTAIREKSGMLHPGCRFPADRGPFAFPDTKPPVIVWNHRWEFDKNPVDFFSALDAVIEKGRDFRLALLGENFQVVPKPFVSARDRLKDRIVQYGYVESRDDYLELLKKGAIVVSTANQENFGISVVEAIRFGCVPVLPNRLSYPEIIPKSHHGLFLYEDQTGLVEKLSDVIQNIERYREPTDRLSEHLGRYSWENMAKDYDRELEQLAASSCLVKNERLKC